MRRLIFFHFKEENEKKLDKIREIRQNIIDAEKIRQIRKTLS